MKKIAHDFLVFLFVQFTQITRAMSSKRNVHHTRTSASVDQESDSDSDSDDERDRVSRPIIDCMRTFF